MNYTPIAEMCVTSVVLFGDILDVLKNTCKRRKAFGGTVIFETKTGAKFVPGKYLFYRLNEQNLMMCLDSVSPQKIHQHLSNHNFDNFKYKHFINRYDWHRLIYQCVESMEELVDEISEDPEAMIDEDLLKLMESTIGKNFYEYSFIVKGGVLNQIDAKYVAIARLEKDFYVMIDKRDGNEFGIVYNMAPTGGYHFGALLKDRGNDYFALSHTEEYVNEDLGEEGPSKKPPFNGIVKIANFYHD